METLTELQDFHFVFQLSRKIVFEVNYYRLGKYFATSAAEFNQPKTDYSHCGQAQNDLLKGYPLAMNFYKKFDPLHLQDLTPEQHSEILTGIEKLKAAYNYTESDSPINFYSIKELSKQDLKKKKNSL